LSLPNGVGECAGAGAAPPIAEGMAGAKPSCACSCCMSCSLASGASADAAPSSALKSGCDILLSAMVRVKGSEGVRAGKAETGGCVGEGAGAATAVGICSGVGREGQ